MCTHSVATHDIITYVTNLVGLSMSRGMDPLFTNESGGVVITGVEPLLEWGVPLPLPLILLPLVMLPFPL